MPRAELHPTMPGGLLTQTEEALRPLSYRWVPGADWNSARGQVTCSLDMWEYINLTCMHMIVLLSIWRETSTHSLIKSECSLLMSVDFRYAEYRAPLDKTGTIEDKRPELGL